VCDKILVSAAILVHYVFRYPAVAHDARLQLSTKDPPWRRDCG